MSKQKENLNCEGSIAGIFFENFSYLLIKKEKGKKNVQCLGQGGGGGEQSVEVSRMGRCPGAKKCNPRHRESFFALEGGGGGGGGGKGPNNSVRHQSVGVTDLKIQKK